MRDLVLYDFWHDMRRHAWNEINCQLSEGSALKAQFPYVSFRVNVSLEKCIYFTLHILISTVTWVMTYNFQANSQLTVLTDSMQPSAPLQDDICEPQQHCQHHSTQQIVNVISPVRLSLYLSLI